MRKLYIMVEGIQKRRLVCFRHVQKMGENRWQKKDLKLETPKEGKNEGDQLKHGRSN